MNDKSYMNELAGFGLTNYEIRIYLSLLEKKQLAATEIARIAKIPRTRVYDDLKSLETKGLCQVIRGKTKLFSAADPSSLRDVLIKIGEEKINNKKIKLEHEIEKERKKLALMIVHEKEELSQKIENIDNLVQKLSPIYENNRNNDFSLDYIEVIKNSIQAEKIYASLAEESKKEILSLVKQRQGTYSNRKDMVKKQTKFGIKIIEKVITSKCIYEIPSKEEERNILFEYVIDEFARAGEQVKVKEELPMRMTIFDEEVVIFSLVDPVPRNPESTSQIVRHPVMAKSMKMIFETLWNQAEDYNEYKKRVGLNK